MLILEIAAGVFLGFCFIGFVFVTVLAWLWRLREWRNDRESQRLRQAAFKRAEKQGWKYDPNSFSSVNEQYEKWWREEGEALARDEMFKKWEEDDPRNARLKALGL